MHDPRYELCFDPQTAGGLLLSVDEELSDNCIRTLQTLGYHETCGFFTVELKIINNKKLAFSPHQISFHMRHPTRTFILAATPDLSTPKLYPGSTILDLRAGKLDACCLQLDAWGSIESLLLAA